MGCLNMKNIEKWAKNKERIMGKKIKYTEMKTNTPIHTLFISFSKGPHGKLMSPIKTGKVKRKSL